MQKRGAIELSVSTIVVLVLAMSMLILGLILVNSIFSGAKYNVDTINSKVQDEIGNLFSEDGRSVVYLASHAANVKQGEAWGVAFAIRNNVAGTSQTGKFSYEVTVSDLSADCKGLSKESAASWIKARRTDTVNLSPGQTGFFLVRLVIPEDAPLCIVPYTITVTKDGQPYVSDFFDLVVK